MNRPRTVDALWAWALREGAIGAPMALHGRESPRVGVRRGKGMNAAPPFTPEFTRYLDGYHSGSPIHYALTVMRNPRRRSPQSLEFRIAWSIVVGRYKTVDELAIALRCSPRLVMRSALRALGVLWDITERKV